MDTDTPSQPDHRRGAGALGATLACVLTAPMMAASEVMEPLRTSPAFVAVRAFADALLAHGRDTYGPERTALIVGQLNARTLRVPQRTPEDPGLFGDDPDVLGALPHHQNLMYDGGLLDLLGGLGELTGDARYASARREYLVSFMACCRDPQSGYFAWGEHIGYDVVADRIHGGGREGLHEIKGVDVPWDLLWEVDAEATRHEIAVALRAHICDERTFAFNRHAHMDGRVNAGVMGPCSLANSGGQYVLAWTWLGAATGDDAPRDWARRLDDFYWNARHPATGLFQSKEMHPGVVWYVDPLQYASLLLRASQLPGPDAECFRSHALAHLHAWAAAAWDAEAGAFYNTLEVATGKGLALAAGERAPQGRHELKGRSLHMRAWTSQRGGNHVVRVLTAAALAYEATGDAVARQLFERAAGLMGLAHGIPDGVQPVPSELASAIHALLSVARRSGDRARIEQAGRLVDHALGRMREGSLFVVTAAGQRYYSARSGCGSLAAAVLAYAVASAGLDQPRLRTRDLIGNLH